MGKVAMSPLPFRGSPPLQSGGQNQKWPTCGQSCYDPPAVSGIPTASEQGEKSEVALKWAKSRGHPCRLGDPHRFTAGGKIRRGPQVGKVATSPRRLGDPHRFRAGGKLEVALKWAKWLRQPCHLGDPHRFKAGGGGGSEVAHLWAKWLCHPCRLGDPHRFRAEGEIRSGAQVGKVAMSPLPSRGSPPLQSGGEIRSGPLVGKVATSPVPSRGSPPLQSGGQNQKCPQVAKWLRHPCRLGDPHRFKAGGGGGLRGGPLMGKLATSPLPSRGSPPLQSGGQNQKWPTSGKVAMSPLPSRGSPPLQSGGQSKKWPTSGQSGYVTPAVSGIPTASERGRKSKVAHLWAKWLHHPRRFKDPHHFRAGGKIRSGPQVGKVATSSLPSRGSPPLQSGGQNQKWRTSGQSGYVTPAFSGIPTDSERGAK